MNESEADKLAPVILDFFEFVMKHKPQTARKKTPPPKVQAAQAVKIEVHPIVQTIFRAEYVRLEASLDIVVLSPLRIAPSSTVSRRGWSIAQGLMESLLVVKHQGTYQPLVCVLDALIVVHIHLLLLHRTP
jgi:hypothetical protein